MLAFNALMAIAAYGAAFALFASVIALGIFIVWRSLRWLARRARLCRRVGRRLLSAYAEAARQPPGA